MSEEMVRSTRMSHGARTDEGGSQTASGKIIPGSSSVHQENGWQFKCQCATGVGSRGNGGGEVEGVKGRHTHTLTYVRVHAKQGDLAFQQC